MQTNSAMKILLENAKTFSERNKITALLESEMKAVNNTMIGNFYQSALEKAHIDFDDIPNSKGNITHYSGYNSMIQSLELVQEIASKNNNQVKEAEVVLDALKNIVAYRESFEKGFRLGKEFVILQYNTLVLACVEATSIIISSYVDFIKRPDRVEFTIVKDHRHGSHSSIDNLAKFNLSVKQGDFSKVLNSVINSGKESLIGADALVIPAFIIGGVLILVPIIRELIFGFYYSRMKVSDYLAQQAALLEINKQSIQASNAPAKEKNEIIKKQARQIDKLRKMSETIKVDRVMSDHKASIELKKENKTWTIDDVQSQSASTDTNGFQLL